MEKYINDEINIRIKSKCYEQMLQIFYKNQILEMIPVPNLLNLLMTFLLFLFVYVAYQIIKSFRFKRFYAKYASSLGYRIFEHQYCWFGSQMYSEFKIKQKQVGDAHYHYKHELSKYDIIVSNLIFRTMLELENPDIVKEFFLKANEGYYAKADFGLAHLRRLIQTDNLLLSEGEFWKNRRKILSTVFNYDFITQQIPKIKQITRLAILNLQKQHENDQQIKINIGDILLNVFSTVVLQCFFKKDELNYIGKERTVDFINKLLTKMTNIARSKQGVLLGVKFAKLGLTQKNRQINSQIEQFRTVAKDIVQKRIKQIQQSEKSNQSTQFTKPGDMIEALMRNKQINLTYPSKIIKQGQISIDSIINEFLTFFLAGSETTLSFTRMMIYRLADNPEIMAKVRQQFERQLNTQQITLEQLKNLKYFEKVQKQTLRMDSSVGAVFTRLATKDHYLGNLKIYKGMVVNIRLRAIHYKEEFYQNANLFNPDRWNDESNINTYANIPFSAGARACIGKHLSLLENKIFMAELLRKYKDITISKKLSDVKMKITTLYGPEEIVTTLTKK